MKRQAPIILAGATMMALFAVQPGAAQPSAGKASIARAVLGKLRSVEQVRFTMQKLGPVFAESVLAQTVGTPGDPFVPFTKTADGKAHLKAVLSEEFSRAYATHVPELTEALVAHLATDLSEADLRAVNGFLDTPAGAHWAAEMTVLQQQSSSTSAAIGARGSGSGVDYAEATGDRCERVELKAGERRVA